MAGGMTNENVSVYACRVCVLQPQHTVFEYNGKLFNLT